MNREPLQNGSEIDVNGTTYRVVNYINRGGSALIYEVISPERSSARKMVLKEFYPQYSHREAEHIVPDRGVAKKEFELWKKRFLAEGKKSGSAANISYQVLHIDQVDAKKGMMVMSMTSEDMIPLTKLLELWEISPPKSDDDYFDTERVRYSLKIISSLLSGLSAIHEKAGLLHGDIAPGNLVWAGQHVESGLHCEAFFLDFGCAQPFNPEGQIEIHTEEDYFGATPGYGAPEKPCMDLADFPIKLGRSYDLYAVAVLLAVLCFGRKVCRNNSWTPKELSEFQCRSIRQQCKKSSLKTEIKEAFEKILQKGLTKNVKDRYQSAGKMQEEIEILLKLMWPKKFQLACKARDPIAGFVGRQEELVQLEQLFSKGVHSVFVTGAGGIGKTEFAIWAASQLKETNTVYHVKFCDNLKKTILKMPFYGMEEAKFLDEKIQYQEIMECLREYSTLNILIIDDLPSRSELYRNIMQSPEYQDLMNLDMRIIFTSRESSVIGENELHLKKLPDEEIEKILFWNKEKIADKIRWRMIQECKGNPAVAVLLARMMKTYEKEITPADLLLLLRDREWFLQENESLESEQKTKFLRIAKQLYEKMEEIFPIRPLLLEERYFLESAFNKITLQISILNQYLETIQEITQAAQARQGSDLKNYIALKKDIMNGFRFVNDFTNADWYLQSYALEIPKEVWYKIDTITFALEETTVNICEALEKYFVVNKYSNRITAQDKIIYLEQLIQFREALQSVIISMCVYILDSVKKINLQEFRGVLRYADHFQKALEMEYQFSETDIQKKIESSMKNLRKSACDLRSSRICTHISKYFLQIGLVTTEPFESQKYLFTIKEPEREEDIIKLIKRPFFELDNWSRRLDDILIFMTTISIAQKDVGIQMIQACMNDLSIEISNSVCVKANDWICSILRQNRINCAEYLSFVNSKYNYLSELRRNLYFLMESLIHWDEKMKWTSVDLFHAIEQKLEWQQQEKAYYAHTLNYFLAYTGFTMYGNIREEVMDQFQSFRVIPEDEWEQTSKMVEQTVWTDLDQMELQIANLSEYVGEQEEALYDLIDSITSEES